MPVLSDIGEVSRIGGQVDSVFIFITVIGLFFFLLTQGALIYFAWRYRRKKTEEERETPYITGNFLLETLWVVIPSLLVLAIFLRICGVQGNENTSGSTEIG
jgi:cytochrome c oxidase subunit 2